MKVIIDSEFRDGEFSVANSPENYTVTLQQELKGVRRAQIEYIAFPMSIFNVNPHNQDISWTGSTTGTVVTTLTEGNYTGATLAAELTTVLTAAFGGTITVSYDVTTNTLSFDMTAATETVTLDATNPTQILTLVGGQNSLVLLSGFTVNSEVIDLSQPHYLWLEVEGMDSGDGFRSTNGVYQFFMPLDVVFGEIAIWRRMNDAQQELMLVRNHLKKLSVRWLWEDGTQCDGINGIDHRIVLRID